jgi:hypothetical protein
MSKYRYILEPYRGLNTRHPCPGCKHREFTRYINTETGQHVNAKVGRCNRQDSCGYHYTPKQYFRDNNISFDETHMPKDNCQPKVVTPQRKAVSFIPVEVFKYSLVNHKSNYFIKFLLDLFGVEVTQQLIARYFIGTSNYWEGATVFWQIDIKGRIRTGKIMLYHATTGKRIKEPHSYITWMHTTLIQPEYALKQCLFGEHLLRDNNNPVALVESEKTAIIASVYMPNIIWLAVGSLNNLNAEKCAVLTGRNIILYPDLGAFYKWSQKAKALSNLATFAVSNLLEQTATEAERQQGLDLADYLTKYNYKDFLNPIKQLQEAQSTDAKQFPSEQLNPTPPKWAGKWIKESRDQQGNWELEINELEKFFATMPLPTNPIQLSHQTTVTDIHKCIESNLLYLRSHNGNKTFPPYLEQLRKLKRILNNGMN